MSILNKTFLTSLLNLPDEQTFPNDYNFYENYMKKDVTLMLRGADCKVLSHIFTGSSCDITVCLLFHYQDKYILFEFFMGTSIMCKRNKEITYFNLIERAVENVYITTNKSEMEKYYFKQLINKHDESNLWQYAQLYTLYPNEIIDAYIPNIELNKNEVDVKTEPQYSFALKPEEDVPLGVCNLSRMPSTRCISPLSDKCCCGLINKNDPDDPAFTHPMGPKTS